VISCTEFCKSKTTNTFFRKQTKITFFTTAIFQPTLFVSHCDRIPDSRIFNGTLSLYFLKIACMDKLLLREQEKFKAVFLNDSL
jgi:hypothetical protein